MDFKAKANKGAKRDSSAVQTSSATTEIKHFNFHYKWMIKNFSSLNRGKGEFIYSPSFLTKTESGAILKWKLKLFPQGEPEAQTGRPGQASYDHYYSSKSAKIKYGPQAINLNYGCYSGRRNNNNNTTDIVYINIKLLLISGKNEDPVSFILGVTNGKSGIYEKTFTKKFSVGEEYGGDIVLRNDFFHSEDTLTITCDGSGYELIDQESESTSVQTTFQLINDFKTFFINKEFCDITFIVSNKEIEAHKLVLAARSAVFKAMFQHDCEERKQNRVVVSDITYEVFQEMLNFIYTGKSDNLMNMAEDLLVVADKYAVLDLKAMCENFMISNINVENACEILQFSDMNSSTNLKSKAVKFIKEHADEVMNTKDLKSMTSTHPHLMVEICHALAKP